MQTALTLFETEEQRHMSQRDRILHLLKANEFVPTSALRLFAYQYNARIKELRESGYSIQSYRQDGIFGFKINQKALSSIVPNPLDNKFNTLKVF